MNEDAENALIENELRALQPAAVSERLAGRISDLLASPGLPPRRAAWWHRLGFARPTAALGWGLASPAMAVAVTLLIVRAHAGTPSPDNPTPRTSAAVESARVTPSKETRNATAANVLHGTFDEGVVPDGDDGLFRRVMYRSTDHVQWRNPRTGAEWEVSYPREDVLLVPINAE